MAVTYKFYMELYNLLVSKWGEVKAQEWDGNNHIGDWSEEQMNVSASYFYTYGENQGPILGPPVPVTTPAPSPVTVTNPPSVGDPTGSPLYENLNFLQKLYWNYLRTVHPDWSDDQLYQQVTFVSTGGTEGSQPGIGGGMDNNMLMLMLMGGGRRIDPLMLMMLMNNNGGTSVSTAGFDITKIFGSLGSMLPLMMMGGSGMNLKNIMLGSMIMPSNPAMGALVVGKGGISQTGRRYRRRRTYRRYNGGGRIYVVPGLSGYNAR